MDNVTAMTTEKEMMGHVKVVMPLFHSTKAQLTLKQWSTALKLQVVRLMEMDLLCCSASMKFKTRRKRKQGSEHLETTTAL